jgi:hypothetical protein
MTGSTFAKLFALAESTEQAEFLNEAGRTLGRVCTDGDMDIQLCRIVDSLDQNGRKLLKRLVEFIDYDAERKQ